MIRKTLLFCFVFFTTFFSCRRNSIVIRELKIDLNDGLKTIQLYCGENIDAISRKVLKAKRIKASRAEKAFIEEGVYIVTLKTDDGEMIYECQNEFWVYDSSNGSFLRCNILDELRKFSRL